MVELNDNAVGYMERLGLQDIVLNVSKYTS